MTDNLRDKQIIEAEVEKINKVKISLQNLKDKKSKFLFFITKTINPSASIYEIYFHTNVVKKMGYDVKILTDANDYEIPYWIEDELTSLPHETMENVRLTVSPEDVLVIPEIFSNVMEKTVNLPCIRVGLLQAIDYMMNALVPSTDWSSFGIKKVITTSESLKLFLEEFMGINKFDISTYDVGIPDYFTFNKELKRPVISVVGRNPNEISKLIKLFYNKYPQYSWLTFDSMITESKPPRALRRKEFAERLRKNFAVVWVDRISSFGTLPLEAMASGTIPIALLPDMPPEYIVERDENGQDKYIENCGVWTKDFYALPILIGDVLTKFLDDSISDDIFDKMKEISLKYSQENSENKLKEIYQSLLDERYKVLESAVNNFEKNNKDLN